MKGRETLHALREAALAAVDPAVAVRRFLRREENTLRLGETTWTFTPERRVWIVGFGKAALPMAEATVKILDSWITGGVVITKEGHAHGHTLPERIEVVEAGHPLPDARGRHGAEILVRCLQQAEERDLVIVLISGGGSALLTLPVEGITLSDLQRVTDLLLRAGAPIQELNAVRKHLSQVKGGRLAQIAAPATVLTLILSDVVGDPLDVIASGPTVPDPTTYAEAWRVLEHYDVVAEVPEPVRAHLQAGMNGNRTETPKPGATTFANVHNCIVGSNRQAAQAAVQRAETLGYSALLLTTFVEGEAREVAKVAAALVKGMRFHGDPLPPPACLVWGGETTVTVTGKGKGGRNQELALAAALALEGLDGFTLMALATDGTDGPTDAGGAIVDGTTVAQARALGLEPEQALRNNDAYPLLAAVDALLLTGPTGTNVNDLLVILVDQVSGA